MNKTIEESEISVFWNEIAKHLPKSVEREALGDEKIYTAFRAAYPKMRKHIVQLAREEERGKVFEALGNTFPKADVRMIANAYKALTTPLEDKK